MAVYLVPLAEGRTIVLDKAVVFVGRHPDCDVVIPHSRKVSRKHCCICQVNDTFVVRDLGSMNGIRLNGQRVKKLARMQFGDELSIGDVPFRFQRNKGAAPPRQPSQEPPARPSSNQIRPGTPKPPLPAAAPVRAVQPPVPRRPIDLSQEFPIPIDEDGGESFAIYGASAEESLGTVGPVDGDDDAPDAMIIDEDSQG